MGTRHGLPAACVAVCVLCLLAGCSGDRLTRLTVGWRDTADQQVAGEYLAQTLARRLPGVTLARRPGLATASQASQSLLSGEVDLVVEYTGTALMDLFELDPEGTPEAQRERVKENYRSRQKCEWFGPLGFENPPVLVISSGLANETRIRTLGEAEGRASGWVFGMRNEFAESRDGVSLLMRRYRLPQAGPIRTAAGAEVYSELKKGSITMAAGRALDAALASGEAIALQDDRHAWPAYEAGIVVRTETLERMPALAPLLRSLAGRLDRPAMAAMVLQVDSGDRSAEVVVQETLSKGAQ